MPGKPRSEDLRVRAIAAVVEDGRTKPLPAGRPKASKLDARRGWLVELRRKENDLTLEAIAGRLLAEHGAAADKSMLSRFFAAERISFKKKRACQRAGAGGRGRSARAMAKDAA